MKKKATLKDLYSLFTTEEQVFKDISSQLEQEVKAIRAEETSALNYLQRLLEGFAAAKVGTLDAPDLVNIDLILKNIGEKNTPLELKEEQLSQRRISARAMAELDKKTGGLAAVEARYSAHERDRVAANKRAMVLRDELADRQLALAPFNTLNFELSVEKLPEIKPEELQRYHRESSAFRHMARWVKDPVYRLAEPVATAYGKKRTAGLKDEVAAYLAGRAEEDAVLMTADKKFAEMEREKLALHQYTEAQALLKSDDELLKQMQNRVVTCLLDNPSAFNAMSLAYLQDVTPEMMGLSARKQLFKRLGYNLDLCLKTAKATCQEIGKTQRVLSKVYYHGSGSRPIGEADLTNAAGWMRGLQTMLKERMQTAQDIRRRAAKPEAVSRQNGSTDSSSFSDEMWLSSYLMNNSSQHEAPFSSGMGGSYAGGGASGSWDLPQSAAPAPILPDSFNHFGCSFGSAGVHKLGSFDFDSLNNPIRVDRGYSGSSFTDMCRSISADVSHSSHHSSGPSYGCDCGGGGGGGGD